MKTSAFQKKLRGFTLVESMIVVVVLSILAAVAYPSYLESMRKSRRNDAKISLMDLASRMDRYYTENNTYATATIGVAVATDVLPGAASADGQYTLSIAAQSATSYTIRATPTAGSLQVGDSRCGTYILTNTGVQTVSGSQSADHCW